MSNLSGALPSNEWSAHLIKVDPHDNLPPPSYNDRTFPIVVSIIFLITLAGGGLLYWHYATQNSAYTNAYSALGIPPVHGEFVNYAGVGIWNRPRQ